MEVRLYNGFCFRPLISERMIELEFICDQGNILSTIILHAKPQPILVAKNATIGGKRTGDYANQLQYSAKGAAVIWPRILHGGNGGD